MKKIIGFAVALVATLFIATPAFAEGSISAHEQEILNELDKGATIGGKQFFFEAADRNLAENHLKSEDVSQADANTTISHIKAARDLAESETVDATNANTLNDALKLLSKSTQDQIRNHIIAAGDALGLKITFGANGSYSVTNAKGKEIYTVSKATGVKSSTSPVKNTGTNYTVSGITFATLLIAAAGAVFVTRKNKLA